MSIVSVLVNLLIVGGSIYLLVKTQKVETWLLTIGSSVNFLTSFFYTVAIQAHLIDFGNFPTDVIYGINTFFYLIFGVGFLLTATRLVKERETLMRNDFQKRE